MTSNPTPQPTPRLRPLKKTAHPIFEVLQVVRMHSKQYGEVSQWVNAVEPRLGQFTVKNGRVYCPKKKGDKVIVKYTEIHQETL